MIAGTCTHTSPFILVDRIGRKSALSTSTVRKPISAGRSFHKPLTHAGLLRNSDQGGTGVLEESAVCAPLEGTEEAPDYSIRDAEIEDWWTVSELHCRVFYPTARCLAGTLLRFDRVESIKGGTAAGHSDPDGNFACMVACLDDAKLHQEHRPQGPRLPAFLRVFASKHLKKGFGRTPEEVGMLGTIIVESLGQHVPPRRHKGRSQVRKGMAYICNLAVDNAFRRRGIGQTLLQQAAKVAKGWGCHAVALHCDPRNAGARRMYQKAGYRKAADEPFLLQFLEGRPGCRLELMVKTLYT